MSDQINNCHCERCHCGLSPEGEPVYALGCCQAAHREHAVKQWKREALKQQDAILALTVERDRLQQENETLNNCAAEREAYRKAWMESEAQRQHLAAQVQALDAAASNTQSRAAQLLKALIIAWDSAETLEFIAACRATRTFFGLKLADVDEDAQDAEVLRVNQVKEP